MLYFFFNFLPNVYGLWKVGVGNFTIFYPIYLLNLLKPCKYKCDFFPLLLFCFVTFVINKTTWVLYILFYSKDMHLHFRDLLYFKENQFIFWGIFECLHTNFSSANYNKKCEECHIVYYNQEIRMVVLPVSL